MSYKNNPIEQYKRNNKTIEKDQEQILEKIPLEQEDNPTRRAAKFIMLLGEEEGSKVLSHLSEEEIEKICSEIARIEQVDPHEEAELLQEFGVRKDEPPLIQAGGIKTAKKYLEQAFGKDKASKILAKAIPESLPQPFDFLNEVELPQLLHLLKDESSFVITLVISKIEPEKAASYIKTLSTGDGSSLLKRLAHMQKIDHSVIETTAETLRNKLNLQSGWNSEEVDGKARLADILKHMELHEESTILEDLKEYNPDLEEEIREKLFTMETLFMLHAMDLQDALQHFSEKDIAILLRIQPENIKELIFENLSERKKVLIEEENMILGPVPRKDAEKNTRQFLQWIKDKTERGEYRILREGEYV